MCGFIFVQLHLLSQFECSQFKKKNQNGCFCMCFFFSLKLKFVCWRNPTFSHYLEVWLPEPILNCQNKHQAGQSSCQTILSLIPTLNYFDSHFFRLTYTMNCISMVTQPFYTTIHICDNRPYSIPYPNVQFSLCYRSHSCVLYPREIVCGWFFACVIIELKPLDIEYIEYGRIYKRKSTLLLIFSLLIELRCAVCFTVHKTFKVKCLPWKFRVNWTHWCRKMKTERNWEKREESWFTEKREI